MDTEEIAEFNYAADRINNDFHPVLPDDDIICRDCEYRKPDLVIEGRAVIKGYKNGRCYIYDTKSKPSGILFRHEDCEHYEKDESL